MAPTLCRIRHPVQCTSITFPQGDLGSQDACLNKSTPEWKEYPRWGTPGHRRPTQCNKCSARALNNGQWTFQKESGVSYGRPGPSVSWIYLTWWLQVCEPTRCGESRDIRSLGGRFHANQPTKKKKAAFFFFLYAFSRSLLAMHRNLSELWVRVIQTQLRAYVYRSVELTTNGLTSEPRCCFKAKEAVWTGGPSFSPSITERIPAGQRGKKNPPDEYRDV